MSARLDLSAVDAWETKHGVYLCINGVHTHSCNECQRINIDGYLAGKSNQLNMMIEWFGAATPTKTINESSPASDDLRKVTPVTMSNVVVIVAAITAGYRVVPTAGKACLIAVRSACKRSRRGGT